MSLKQQVVSLELSQRLAELGVKQESLFYWVSIHVDDRTPIPYLNYGRRQSNCGYKMTSISAFTVAELGEMLYSAGAKNFMKAYGDVFNFPGTAFVGDLGVINLMRKPDMAAKMLIYLIENNLITL